jgi:prepilin-type N-terminal cleavage/methylation domain-containing protein
MRYAAHKHGFTTIEILIVLIVSSVLFVVATSAFSRFNKNQALAGSAEDVMSILNKARGQTLASKDDYAYGVHFESDRIILFLGSSYDPVETTNETTLLSALVTITNISLVGGGDDVLFQKLSGKTSESGTITIALTGDTSESTIITVLPTGIAEKD